MLKFMRRILRNNSGATAIEYGLIAALIVIAIMAALNGFASSANAMLTRVADKVDTQKL